MANYAIDDEIEEDGKYSATILNVGNETVQLVNHDTGKKWRVLPGDLQEELESGVLTLKKKKIKSAVEEKYGVFIYKYEGDEHLPEFDGMFLTLEEANKYLDDEALNVVEDLKREGINAYAEMWEAAENGTFGESGEPLFTSWNKNEAEQEKEEGLIYDDEGRLAYGSKKIKAFESAQDLISFLEGTLIPDLRSSEDDATAEDFEDLVSFLKGKKKTTRWKSQEDFIDYLEGTYIPDLKESGKDATAEDLEEGIKYLRSKTEGAEKKGFFKEIDVFPQDRSHKKENEETERAMQRGKGMLVVHKNKIDNNHKDSFWYRGLIAEQGGYELIANGDIRVQFDEDGIWYKDEQARDEALDRGLTDKDIHALMSAGNFGNNNWFEIMKEGDNTWGDTDSDDYDSAIEGLKWYAEGGDKIKSANTTKKKVKAGFWDNDPWRGDLENTDYEESKKNKFNNIEELKNEVKNTIWNSPDYITVGGVDYIMVEYSGRGVSGYKGSKGSRSKDITYADEDTLKKEIRIDYSNDEVYEDTAGIDWASSGFTPRKKTVKSSDIKADSERRSWKAGARNGLADVLVEYVFAGDYKSAYESLVRQMSDDEFISGYEYIKRMQYESEEENDILTEAEKEFLS